MHCKGKRGVAGWSLIACMAVGAGAARADGGNWTEYTGDKSGSRYLAGGKATAASVKNMKIAWRLSLPGNDLAAENPDLRTWVNESTPLAVDGTVYATSPLGIVTAVDGTTGKEKWLYDPQGYLAGQAPNLGFISRGLTYVVVDGAKRIIAGTPDGFLIMLDAETGKPVESWGENGRVDLTIHKRRPVQRDLVTVSSPPIVCGGNIIPSLAVLDSFAAGRPPFKYHPPGDVPAFDLKTGKRVWMFHNPPLPGEAGAESWKTGLEETGGTNLWSRPSCDDETGTVYLPLSTPSNDFYGGHRLGDNLFSETLVALDAKTGKRDWHFQIVHHGLWDYDLPTNPNLMDITVDGKKIKAAVQVTKQGYVYAFDRVTGKPIWPIEEKAVPAGNIPGEEYSPTQPVPSKPAPYVQQGASEADLIDLTPELKEQAKKILKRYNYGPLFTPPTMDKAGTLQVPGVLGGASWAGAAHNPKTGMLYVPSFTIPFAIKIKQEVEGASAHKYTGTWAGVGGPDGLPLFKPPFSTITAIDMNTGDHKWRVPAGRGPVNHPAVKAAGLDRVGATHQSFIVITDDIVFTAPNGAYDVLGLNTRGNALIAQNKAKQDESALYAYDAKSGDLLGEIELPLGVYGALMSYTVGDTQYVVAPVGGAGTPSELVAVQVN
jgi:quinoprotein glucose dehydrogenase